MPPFPGLTNDTGFSGGSAMAKSAQPGLRLAGSVVNSCA